MRVCILEWICGGGLHHCNPDDVSPSLIEEGWAMLQCLCQQFSSYGLSVTTTVDRRIVGQQSILQLSTCTDSLECFQTELVNRKSTSEFQRPSEQDVQRDENSPSASLDVTLGIWQKLAAACDVSIVVAPEMDRILEACIHRLSQTGIRVVNCCGDLLSASCDKWLTAQHLHRHRISHPMTWLADEFCPDALKLSERWCVKPRWGAGCEGLRILDSEQLSHQLSRMRGEPNMLIQTWREGQAFSCSAVADFNGAIEWLPLVTQEFARTNSTEYGEQLCYRGARLASTILQSQRPIDLLNRLLGALSNNLFSEARGWIGVDLLLGDQQNWTIIEVNSRLTTSAVQLCRLNHIQLASQMLSGYNKSVGERSVRKPLQ